MLRVRADRLALGADGLLHWQGMATPYDGAAYHMTAAGRLAAIVSVAGGVAGAASSDWIDLPAGGERMDYAALDVGDGSGPCLLDGSPFAGVGYTFEADGQCSAEMLYADGFATETSGREWYPGGAPQRFIDPAGTVAEWAVDGTLDGYVVGAELRYGITLGDNGRVGVLTLADRSLLDTASLERLGFDEEVWLIGPAIDAAVLRALAGLQTVSGLRLIRTAFTAADLAALAALPALRTVWLQENPGLDAAAARQLAAARGDWTVYLDDMALPGPTP